MLGDPPKTSSWMIWALLTVAMIEAARRAEPDGWRGLALAVAVIFGSAAIVNMAYWLAYRVAAQWRMLVAARAVTERVEIMRTIEKMQPHHLRYLETVDPTVITLPGSPGPVVMLMRISGVEIPYEFVAQFFDASQGPYLVPVGTFAEGSKQRQWATVLTSHFVAQGFAERAVGNRSAKWRDRKAAEGWVNLTRLIQLTT